MQQNYKAFCAEISIHAPRKGVRQCPRRNTRCQTYFNPRTPQGGATSREYTCGLFFLFQSTHPARGCDAQRCNHADIRRNFNPRTPQGGATALNLQDLIRVFISIHAPRKGVRHIAVCVQHQGVRISIHAPRKGVRLIPYQGNNQPCYFNPRTPQGGATLSAFMRA